METEVRLVFWKDKKVTDIIAKVIDVMPQKRSPRLLRALESLLRFQEHRQFLDYDTVTIEIAQFEKLPNGNYERGNSITLPF